MNQTVILDISSDDEVGFDDSSTADNFDWVSKFLEDVPSKDDVNYTLDVASNGGDDDSDDVVVVGEVLAKPKRAKVLVPRYRNDGFDDDNDDCVVLNCDPYKPKQVTELGQDKCSDEDSDDLVIVGEKGQCHCYVCDSLAPCAYWGSGDSVVDHCCATDKLEYWKLERKKMRESKNPPAPIAKPAADSLSRLAQLQQTSAQPTPVLRPASTCGVSSSFGLPNIISHSRSQRPSIAVPRSRFQPHQVRGQPLGACNISTPTHRNSIAPNLASSRSVFKRSGFTSRTGVAKHSAYLPQNNSASYWQQMLNGTLVGKSAQINSINLTESSPHLGGNISSNQPIVSGISTATLPSHTQSYNNSVAQTPTSQFPVYGQSTVGTTDNPWAYSSGSQIQNGSWPVMDCNTSNAVYGVTLGSQQSSAVIQNVTGPSFPGNASDGLSSIAPRIRQPSEAVQSFSCSAYPYNTLNSTNSIAQTYQQLSAENRQAEGAVPGNELLPSIEHNPQISGSLSSSSLDFDLDRWLPENDPILGGQDSSDLFNMSNQPSMAVDAGMLLFDFETSWKGLAHS
ncbi:hypothetical protein Cgig2_020802 [Carnegiea gigantea]|uniref:Uncharacterized protein n=1 Tax=Carnegiea gigantea TaxID=171969 RepID=A0A9Q1QJM0_9CARY|nr:hypothetical protein Cgig2_020802 [Carnegiea gigantea]